MPAWVWFFYKNQHQGLIHELTAGNLLGDLGRHELFTLGNGITWVIKVVLSVIVKLAWILCQDFFLLGKMKSYATGEDNFFGVEGGSVPHG